MRRTLTAIAFASALAATLTATSALAAGGQASARKAESCHLSTKEQRHLGASYVTSLKVDNTTCAKGKSVTLAFNNCRTAGGKPQGTCNRKVGRYSCSERRYDAVPSVQYSSKVTCRWGRKRVWSTYTENT